MRALFRRAEKLTRDTGVLYSVDHHVPLQHPLVCGLHWHANMSVALMHENNRKNNRTWPDMWETQPELFDGE